MLSMLIAYNAANEVIATLDFMSTPLGIVDFTAHEDAGGKLRDIWDVDGAVGSATWPEWIGSKAHDFKAEVDPATKKIKALVHKKSGHRRERSAVEGEIAKRIKDAKGKPADIRDVVGGPDRPLLIDENGRTKKREKVVRPNLPLVPVHNEVEGELSPEDQMQISRDEGEPT